MIAPVVARSVHVLLYLPPGSHILDRFNRTWIKGFGNWAWKDMPDAALKLSFEIPLPVTILHHGPPPTPQEAEPVTVRTVQPEDIDTLPIGSRVRASSAGLTLSTTFRRESARWWRSEGAASVRYESRDFRTPVVLLLPNDPTQITAAEELAALPAGPRIEVRNPEDNPVASEFIKRASGGWQHTYDGLVWNESYFQDMFPVKLLSRGGEDPVSLAPPEDCTDVAFLQWLAENYTDAAPSLAAGRLRHVARSFMRREAAQARRAAIVTKQALRILDLEADLTKAQVKADIAPEQVTAYGQLNDLPSGSIILSADGIRFERNGGGCWLGPKSLYRQVVEFDLPVQVIHRAPEPKPKSKPEVSAQVELDHLANRISAAFTKAADEMREAFNHGRG